MVSRRNYFSIMLMMAVLFFMFQFTQVVKDSGNRYDENEYAVPQEEMPSGMNKWQPSQEAVDTHGNGYVLFFGDAEDALGNIVSQWCTYTKRDLVTEKLSEYRKPQNLPELILVDSVYSEVGRKSVMLEPVMQLGVPVVFCNLPDAEAIAETERLQEMLGIQEVRALETQVEGVQLFSGFLLGGEAIYKATTPKEQERQDLELAIPWYITGSGTKTYMVGMLDEDVVEREDFPSLIWRNTYEDTKVFAVCGDYMSSYAGLGILDSIVYELNPYEIYPIVNAQNIMIANFPNFSGENAEEIQRLYSRSPQMVYKDLMWPSISAMTETNDLKLTCFFNPQYDYQDGLEPVRSEVEFYLKQLKELRSEAGMALKYRENSTFEEMLQKDADFYASLESNYQYQAAYVEHADWERAKQAAGQEGLLREIRTLVCDYNPQEPLLSYVTENVTLQNATGNATGFTYMDELAVKGIQTALGYSNVLLDLHAATWPQAVTDEWQILYDQMSSNVQTYWRGNSGFQQTTLSESDLRVRNFLNLDYKDGRSGDTVVLEINNVKGEAWFLLRTHAEKIADIRGGEYQQLEEDVYMIKAVEGKVELDLVPVTLTEQVQKDWQ